MFKNNPHCWRAIAAGVIMTTGATFSAQAEILTDEARFEAGELSVVNRVESDRSSDWSDADIDRDEPFVLAGSRPAAARATYSVGPGPGCDFPSLNAALAVAGDGDVINLTNGNGYAGLTYEILHRPGTLTIRGGFSDCSQPVPDAGRTTLDADGAGRVFYIEIAGNYSGDPMEVNLERLTITGGDTTGSFGGGGVLVSGRAGKLSVNLRNVWVENNVSSSGGGGGVKVRINGPRDGSGTLLTIDNDSALVSNSTSGNGGGLSCESLAGSTGSTLIRLGHFPMVGNEAENGGALSNESCGRIFHYPGYFLSGVLGNVAQDAGGAFYVEGDGANLVVRGDSFLGLGEESNGALISGNTARIGGALYARDDSYVSFLDSTLNNNSAEDAGGALYANAGSAVVNVRRINQSQPCGEAPALGTARCSRVLGNSSPIGAAFYARNDATINVSQTRVENNDGDTLAHVSGAGPGTINMESVLFTGNTAERAFEAINGLIDLRWSTMVDNDFSWALRAVTGHQSHNARINAYSSVLWETGTQISLMQNDSVSIYADCLIGWVPPADADFTGAFRYRHVDPEFADPADGNFRLGMTSPAIDFCDGYFDPQFPDLDGNERGQPHQGPPLSPGGAGEGDYDLGAYEAGWLRDEMFRDRFEAL